MKKGAGDNNHTIKVVELFSGIGSQAKALKNIGAKFETVGTCEWDIRAIVAYDLIHNDNSLCDDAKDLDKKQLLAKLSAYELSGNSKKQISAIGLKSLKEEVLRKIYSSIIKTKNHIDIKALNGEQLDSGIDIMTYSFPCQDLSNAGQWHGYNKGIDRDADSRSGLLWQVERILLQRKEKYLDLPKILMLENVTALLSKRHKANFDDWKHQLQKMGYYNHVYNLRSDYFGAAQQNRSRLIMISVLDDGSKKQYLDEYFGQHNLQDKVYRDSLKMKVRAAKDHLKIDYTNPKYWKEALSSQPNDTQSRQKIYDICKKIVDHKNNISSNVATITTKQDRRPNAGVIYFDYEGNTKSKFRYLTPRECFCFMGFDESDFDRVVDNNIKIREGLDFFTRDNLLRMAGNSIVVQILEKVFEQILDILQLF